VSRVELWLLHAGTALVGGTGLVYAWMLYLLKPDAQHLHVLAAPLLVFAAGLIWRRHVWGGWRSGQPARRRSGVALALTLLPMVASGYLLQTAVDDAWRQAWVAVHLAASALWLAGYLVHQLAPRERRVTA
jgi:hypothetical protein